MIRRPDLGPDLDDVRTSAMRAAWSAAKAGPELRLSGPLRQWLLAILLLVLFALAEFDGRSRNFVLALVCLALVQSLMFRVAKRAWRAMVILAALPTGADR